MSEKQIPEEPNIPDTIDELIEQLYDRETQRRKAVDLAFERFEAAESPEDRNDAMMDYLRMLGVLEEFRSQFPEVFPDEGENQ